MTSQFNVNATLFARVANAASLEEARFYLHGVSIEPAPAAATRFTVQSWNNTDPETFPTSVLAITAATFRAKVEGTLVKVLDNVTDEQAEVHADGHVGKWL